MALRDWISEPKQVATMTVAITATHKKNNTKKTVSNVANVNVASRGKKANRQVSCRAFLVTKVLMATKTEDCIDQQSNYCGNCELRKQNASGKQ